MDKSEPGGRAILGLLWWLNTDRKSIPAAPTSAASALGFGGNVVYVDRENDLVVVLRRVPGGGSAAVVAAVIDALDFP